MSDSKGWIVTVTGGKSVEGVARDLKKGGFEVSRVLGEIGCITGSASDEVADRVRAMPGVADVSPDEAVDIGPPGESETW